MARSLLFVIALLISSAAADQYKWLSPVYNYFFQFPLPIPPIKSPIFTATSRETGLPIDYYEVDIKPLFAQKYPNLGPARLVGYDGIAPGPQFRMTQNREAIVRFINHGDRANSVHLHGSFSRAPFDGWADDTTEVQQYKDYYYPNRQNARTLWYHDHAVDHTAENAYFGQAGAYILHDSEEQSLGIPQGQYDIPLGLTAKRYNANGTLWDPEINDEQVSLFGDVFEVNGQPWPYLAVEPRKYRFRFINMGISRSFILYMNADQQKNATVPWTVIGSDAGLSLKPIQSDTLTISIAERWEVVVDFAQYAGQNVTVKNQRDVGADEDYAGTDRLMRFVVGNTVTSTANNGPIPSPLRNVPFPPQTEVADRHFKFERSNGRWEINGVVWSDISERVMAPPQRGSIEVWELQNGGGGWTHPIHIHLIDFQVISRTGGKRGVLPYEATSLQDVVWLDVGETVRVIARFAPWPGLYMFHCHNLIHEDHEMLAAFNVTQVPGLNLNETNLFIDPMDPIYRAKPFNQADFISRTGPFSTQAIQDKVNFFTALDAYADVDKVEAQLAAFWASKNATKVKRDALEGKNVLKRGILPSQ